MYVRIRIISMIEAITGDRLNNLDGLEDNGTLDSLGIMSLVADVEHHYKITIREEDFIKENFNSVDAIVKLVEVYTGQGE